MAVSGQIKVIIEMVNQNDVKKITVIKLLKGIKILSKFSLMIF